MEIDKKQKREKTIVYNYGELKTGSIEVTPLFRRRNIDQTCARNCLFFPFRSELNEIYQVRRHIEVCV